MRCYADQLKVAVVMEIMTKHCWGHFWGDAQERGVGQHAAHGATASPDFYIKTIS